MELRKIVSGHEPIYMEICQKEEEANRFSYELEKRVINNKHHKLGENAAKALVTGLAIQSAVNTVYACDKTLFLLSNGKVCDGNECTNVNMYSIPI